MKILTPRKKTPGENKNPTKSVPSDDHDSLFEWDNLGKNLKGFWEDLIDDIIE